MSLGTAIWTNAPGAATTLAASISSTATSISLVNGGGFPAPVSGTSFFSLTLTSASNSAVEEIVYCTARSGNTCTVLRGQEGTTAQPFNAGDLAANLVTAGDLALFPQLGSPNVWTAENTFQTTALFGGGVTVNGLDPSTGQVRMVGGTYGAFFQNNGASLYLLLTNAGTPYGTFNGYRPFTVTLSSGAVIFDQTGAGATFGGTVDIGGGFSAAGAGAFGGQVAVSAATLGGNAVNLSQLQSALSSYAPQINYQNVVSPVNGQTYTFTIRIIAPCAGHFLASWVTQTNVHQVAGAGLQGIATFSGAGFSNVVQQQNGTSGDCQAGFSTCDCVSGAVVTCTFSVLNTGSANSTEFAQNGSLVFVAAGP